jgi:hypothetical protein
MVCGASLGPTETLVPYRLSRVLVNLGGRFPRAREFGVNVSTLESRELTCGACIYSLAVVFASPLLLSAAWQRSIAAIEESKRRAVGPTPRAHSDDCGF